MVVAEAALRRSIPVVEGGVKEYSGFNMNIKRGFACIGCLWGDLKDTHGAAPVLGAVAGVIGSLQAVQAVKILLGEDEDSFGKVWMHDLNSMSFETLYIERDPSCPICGDLY